MAQLGPSQIYGPLIVNGLLKINNLSIRSRSMVQNLNAELLNGKDSTEFSSSSHVHGNITTDGKIGSAANLMLQTGSGGTIQTKPAGTTVQYLRGDGEWATPPDTIYTHPANHPPSIITQDASNRFVTDAEKAAWNAKASTAVATTSVDGLMSASDKTKLDGVAANANNYTHPANHPPSIITQDASNRFVTDTEKATWNAKASTAVATTGANGLMSSTDKTKLDSVVANANNYTHPNHTGDVTSVADGATTIANNVVTNAKLATVATATIKGRVTAATGNVEDLTAAQVRTLLNVADGANNYTHPANHPPSIITQDASNRFVTDSEKAAWNAKQTALGFTPENLANKGVANGYAELDATGKIPSGQLPSFVDDVLEFANFSVLPGTGESGKIYVTIDDNKTFRWSGSAYAEISASLALGTTSTTAYRGDHGLIAYNHAQITHAPSNAQKNSDITKAEIEAKLTGEITTHTHTVATTSAAGYMSSADKTKLDGVAANATNYTHPANHPPSIITQDASNRFVTDAEKSTWNAKASTAVATTSVDGLMSATDKTKLDGVAANANNYTHPNHTGDVTSVADGATTIANNVVTNAKLATVATATIKGRVTAATGNVEDLTATQVRTLLNVADGANNYTHPANHPASIITQDASNRFVTDAEKTTWNAKASTAVATTSVDGLMSASDKTKLDGVAANANNYSHPANHPASIITQDASNRFVTDTEKSTWNAKASTAVATTGSNGLMSSTDKTKLEGIASNANNYTHPTDDGNLHVPATGTTNNGKFLMAGATAGSLSWEDVSSGAVAATKTGNSNFAASTTSKIVYDPLIKTTTYVLIRPTGTKIGTWDVESFNGYFTVTSSSSEAVSATFAWAAIDDGVSGGGGGGSSVWGSISGTLSDQTDLNTALNNKASTSIVTTSVNGLMSSADKTKLDGVADNANNYTHPANHPPSIITQDASNRFVTDTEKSTWNAKASTAVATTSVDGLMSAADKTKLNGVASNANNYTHPTNDGNLHVPATGTTNNGKFLMAGATAGSLSWGSPSGGGSIDNYSDALTASITMPTTGIWYDGPSISLPAGTWFIMGHVTFRRSATTATYWFTRITDRTNHYASSQSYTASLSGIALEVTMHAIVTIASTTTIQIQSTTSAGATACTMLHALSSYTSGNNATRISAIRLA